MKPHYQDDLITLYHADCLEHPELWCPDHMRDAGGGQGFALVTDPPYGMDYKSKHTKTKKQERIRGDEDTKARDAVLELWGSRPALVFGTWRVEKPSDVKNVIAWCKGNSPGMGDLSMPWGLSWEEVYVKGTGFVGSRVPNYLSIPVQVSNAIDRPDHPTPKPVELMERLLEKIPTDWVIIDPFAGSGSTLRAAKNLGRRAIGIEIERKYCDIIAKRLGQETLIF